MKKTLRAIALALVLAMPVAGATQFVGCAAVGGIFESDPVGASLLTMKDGYEASVRTAGRLYVQGLITEAQLRNFVAKARQFHVSYTALVAVHEESKLTTDDVRFKSLTLAFNALQALVASFTK
jgi:hypothetical protein